jgi:hypothetical protein
MPRRLKKIKGGMNDRYVEKIRNLSRLNNLKSLEELKVLGVLSEVERHEYEFEKYDKGYYFYDGYFESGDRFVSGDFYIEPILQKRLKYEDAILINGNLYNIVDLYDWVIIRGNTKDAYNLPISDYDKQKIENFHNKNDFDVEHLIDYSRYNNLKSLAELKTLGYVDDYDFLIDKDNKQRINGKNSNEPIKYENAIIINGVLYDINNLVEYLKRRPTIKVKKEDNLKIQTLKIDFITLITSKKQTYNNLKPSEDLKRLKFIDKDKEIIDREGEKIKDPLTNKPIKYENAIIIKGVLYDITNLLELFANNQIQEKIKNISEADLEKIKSFNFDFSLSKDNSTYNNLKSFDKLRQYVFFRERDGKHYFFKKDGEIFKDPVTQKEIEYKQAFLLGDVLYDINVLFEWVIIKKNYTDPVSNLRLSEDDISKIGNYNVNIDLILNPHTPNNLKTIEELKQQSRVLSRSNLFLDKNGNEFQILLFGDILYRSNNLRYNKAILINGFLHNFEELYSYLFDGENIGNYIKRLFGEIVKVEDTIKIYNLKHKIDPYLQDNITVFKSSLEELKRNCQKIKDKIQRIDELITGDLDITNLRRISNLIDDIFIIYTFDVYRKFLSISTISDLRLIGSIFLTNTVIEVLKCFFKCLFALYKFGDNNHDCNSYRTTLFKKMLWLIEKINDFYYYTFQLVIAVGIKESHFSPDYLNSFERILDEVNNIVMTSREKSAEILGIQEEIKLYKLQISRIFVSISPSMKKDRRKLLTDAYKSIKEEYLNVLKNYFKSQENSLDIYRFCNIRFMNIVKNQRKDNEVLITKAELLSKNNEKLHRKSKKSFENVKKIFEKYGEYKTPPLIKRFAKSISKSIKTYTRRRVLPEIPTSPQISPFIQVFSPSP